MREGSPDDPFRQLRETVIEMTRALAGSGPPDEAAVHYRRVLQLDPNNAIARRRPLRRARLLPPRPDRPLM
ncbi:MAG TPA: tetratricopeptide repeat protein [Pirellulales bacterium]|jgi:hypothetical protein|nr:tetratricopeptide repeat protein [Pirellulales bacterium]